jgi:diguanylate cyclase
MKNNTISTDIARQTLTQLAKNSLPPTPENYANTYNQIAGNKSSSVSKSLQNTLSKVSKNNPQFVEYERSISSAVKKQDWTTLETELENLLSKSLNNKISNNVNWATLIRSLLKQLETGHKGITLSRKKEGLNKVLINFAKDPSILAEKIQALMRSWGSSSSELTMLSSNSAKTENHELPSALESHQNTNEEINSESASILREMMIRTLDLALIPLLDESTQSQEKAKNLLEDIRHKNQVTEKSANDLKGVLFSIETELEEKDTVNEALIDLLALLAKSMSELIADDKWLKGQMDIINDVLAKPVNPSTLQNAESSLKALIHKQSNLKPALYDAQELLKQMAKTFITRLVDLTESTDEYHNKIEGHQQKLNNINGIDELNGVLHSVLEDTRTIGLTVQRTREEFTNSQNKVNAAELKIQELTSVLDYINEVANEDYLTGTLNRRGMEEALEREFNRADRHHTALSIAMMDIDHFKKLNDELGHTTGDEALTHFANVIKKVKRTTDVLARYGGEEFIIILPNTMQNDAIKVIERVQRMLTKEFFMHSDKRILITFSAGVAQRIDGETPDEIIPRADAAMYEAKANGRNRVIGAPIEADIVEIVSPPSSDQPFDETRH